MQVLELSISSFLRKFDHRWIPLMQGVALSSKLLPASAASPGAEKSEIENYKNRLNIFAILGIFDL